jgi:hypothetical protein
MKTIKFLFIFLIMASISAFSQETQYWAFCDIDEDGHACPGKLRQIPADKVFYYLSQGWLVSNHKPPVDCDDNNDMAFHSVKGWIDLDGDKYITGYALLCIGTEMPVGYIREADILGYRDCDDADPSVWVPTTLYFDGDGDGWIKGVTGTFCVGAPATYPANYIPKSAVNGYQDCDDANAGVWRTICKSGYPGPNYEVCVGNEVSDCGIVPPAAKEPLDYAVYPNPVRDRLNITPNENWNNRVEIRLIDQFGRVARVVNNSSAVKGQAITVNTGDLKPGIYNLTIKNGELMTTKQIGVKL